MPKLTPDNILAFMSANIVTTPSNLSSATIPYADANDKLIWAALQPSTRKLSGAAGGAAVYWLDLIPPDEADAESFLIYWVEYEQDGPGVSTWLGSKAPLMFTAMMTGCTFGLGSSTTEGVMAAHVNSAGRSQTGLPDATQIADQARKLGQFGLNRAVVEPATYLGAVFDTAVKTTPFGYRPTPRLSGGQMPDRRIGRGGVRDVPSITALPWKFCWQKYKVVGTDVTHQGVAQHAGGIIS